MEPQQQDSTKPIITSIKEEAVRQELAETQPPILTPAAQIPPETVPPIAIETPAPTVPAPPLTPFNPIIPPGNMPQSEMGNEKSSKKRFIFIGAGFLLVITLMVFALQPGLLGDIVAKVTNKPTPSQSQPSKAQTYASNSPVQLNTGEVTVTYSPIEWNTISVGASTDSSGRTTSSGYTVLYTKDYQGPPPDTRSQKGITKGASAHLYPNHDFFDGSTSLIAEKETIQNTAKNLNYTNIQDVTLNAKTVAFSYENVQPAIDTTFVTYGNLNATRLEQVSFVSGGTAAERAAQYKDLLSILSTVVFN